MYADDHPTQDLMSPTQRRFCVPRFLVPLAQLSRISSDSPTDDRFIRPKNPTSSFLITAGIDLNFVWGRRLSFVIRPCYLSVPAFLFVCCCSTRLYDFQYCYAFQGTELLCLVAWTLKKANCFLLQIVSCLTNQI